MKRVWSDSKFPPEKVKKRDIEIYSNKRGMSKTMNIAQKLKNSIQIESKICKV